MMNVVLENSFLVRVSGKLILKCITTSFGWPLNFDIFYILVVLYAHSLDSLFTLLMLCFPFFVCVVSISILGVLTECEKEKVVIILSVDFVSVTESSHIPLCWVHIALYGIFVVVNFCCIYLLQPVFWRNLNKVLIPRNYSTCGPSSCIVLMRFVSSWLGHL